MNVLTATIIQIILILKKFTHKIFAKKIVCKTFIYKIFAYGSLVLKLLHSLIWYLVGSAGIEKAEIVGGTCTLFFYCSSGGRFKLSQTTPTSLLAAMAQFPCVPVLVLALPKLTAQSSSRQIHPAMPSGSISEPVSWQCFMDNGAIFAILPFGGSTSYLLHPLSVEVSVAPVKVPSSGGAAGLGVHMDVATLRLSLSQNKVSICCYSNCFRSNYFHNNYFYSRCFHSNCFHNNHTGCAGQVIESSLGDCV